MPPILALPNFWSSPVFVPTPFNAESPYLAEFLVGVVENSSSYFDQGADMHAFKFTIQSSPETAPDSPPCQQRSPETAGDITRLTPLGLL